ncbi:hypothetical protein [Homoserinibacter sp. GY 40078]|uniref:phage tail protein n=1 Tax=Homoserinibacter sp. GY 40078 TaxID=2603275 RepID=UPI0011CC3280|nr:hypothetical protein [Homoserinibacter sp. GY 40078]TXK18450.1 hypothetical protein FVQ89_00335 [Homoserinibacter sp. GY 40078]
MALDLGDLVGRLVLEDEYTPKLDRADDKTQRFTSSAGSMFVKFGGVLAGVFASVQIGQWVSDGIGYASDLNETLNKSSAIFGTQAGSMEKWSSTAATSLGLSQAAALNAAASFGDMFTQIGFTGDAAANMAKEVVQASADLGSFSNLDTADVADRLSAAFRGEYDALQAVIPNINAARVESEALAMTGKKVAAELTAQERAAAVLAIVHQDGARAMGDFAKTSDGFANQQKIVAAQMEEVGGKVGELLLPALNALQGILLDYVIPGLEAVVGFISENVSWLGPLAAGIGIVVGVIGAWTAVQWLLNAAMTANPIGVVIVAIGLLIGAIILLVQNWDTVIAWIGDTWEGFVGWLTDSLAGLASWWEDVWSGITGFFEDLWKGYVQWVISTTLGFINWWNGLWRGIASFFSELWNGIVGFITDAWDNVIGWLGGVPQMLLNVFAGAALWLFEVGQDIIGGLWRGLEDIWNGLIGWIGDIGQTIADTFADVLGIHSPSLVFRGFGVNIMDGLAIGLEDGRSTVDNQFGSMLDPLLRGPASSSSTVNHTVGPTYVVNLENNRAQMDEEALYAALGGPRLAA